MNYYIPFAILCVLLSYIRRNHNRSSANVFVATMVVTFVFAAIRYRFGPDWFSYYDVFLDLRQLGAEGYLDYHDHSEPAFIHYFSLFPYYTLFLAVNSLFWFSSYTVYFRKYVDARYYWFVLLMLFFNTDCILNNLVAMRQAISGFLLIFGFLLFIKYKDKIKGKILFAVILLLCSLIHTSCLALIPLLFINDKKSSILFSKWYIVVVIFLSLFTVFVGRHAITNYIASFLVHNIEDFQRYETYLEAFEGTTTTSLMALLKYVVLLALNIVPFLFIVLYGKKEKDPIQIYILKIGIVVSTIGCVMGQGIMSRYMMMLNPFYIAALVRVCLISNNRPHNILVLACASSTTLYSFYHYLQADYCVSFLTYQTVFSAPFIP